jgi:hypothetical protein
MIVVGGTYFERCAFPEWDALYGSGLRAAIQLAKVGALVELHTFASPYTQRRMPHISNLFDLPIRSYRSSATYIFDYVHSLTAPTWEVKYDNNVVGAEDINLSSKTCLVYGMMEGHAVVSAERAVYDPQSSNSRFRQHGSSADHLALVLNASEARTWGGEQSLEVCAEKVAKVENASIVVIKNGPYRALIWDQANGASETPAYEVDRIFKIGSGDIFSSIFAYLWAEKKLDAIESARIASKATAYYVNTRQFIDDIENMPDYRPVKLKQGAYQVYLAGPFFTVGERWLINDLRDIFLNLGISVVSPIHDFGIGPDREVATADLAAIKKSDAVFAVVSGGDPGTLFEVGYARSIDKPVIAFSQNSRPTDHTMLSGTGCLLETDIGAAVYKTAWQKFE